MDNDVRINYDVTPAFLNELKEAAYEKNLSVRTHLNVAIYDLNVEQGWEKPTTVVFSLDDVCFVFLSYTKSYKVNHCTLRHIFTLDDYQGKGYAKKAMQAIYDDMRKRDIYVLRFFSAKKSITFYEKLGFEWHGLSKSGLPFTYWNINTNKLARLPGHQQRYVVELYKTKRSLL